MGGIFSFLVFLYCFICKGKCHCCFPSGDSSEPEEEPAEKKAPPPKKKPAEKQEEKKEEKQESINSSVISLDVSSSSSVSSSRSINASSLQLSPISSRSLIILPIGYYNINKDNQLYNVLQLQRDFSVHYCYVSETKMFAFTDAAFLNLLDWMAENNIIGQRDLQSILYAEASLRPKILTEDPEYNVMTQEDVEKIIKSFEE